MHQKASVGKFIKFNTVSRFCLHSLINQQPQAIEKIFLPMTVDSHVYI